MAEETIAPLSPLAKRRKARLAYYYRHRDERLAYGHTYYAENTEKALAYYYAKKDGNHSPRIEATDDDVLNKKRLYAKGYYDRFKDDESFIKKKKKKDKVNRIKNREKRRVYARLRNAKKKNVVINDFTEEQWLEIVGIFQYRCAYCRKKFALEKLTRDHVTPLSKGGGHTVSNIVPACLSCNAKKGNRDVLKPVQPILLTVA